MRYFITFFLFMQNLLQAFRCEGRRLNIFFRNSQSILTSFNPLAFWFFLLTIPLVVLFLLKKRPVRKNISTTIFWKRVLKKQPRLWEKRPRQLLSLLIALTFVTLLIFALADPSGSPFEPQFSSASKRAPNSDKSIPHDKYELNKNTSNKIHSNSHASNHSSNIVSNENIADEKGMKEVAPRDVVIILDNSASMNALEEGNQTRFELAQKALDQFLARKEKGETALLTSGGDCQVISGWTPAASSLLLRRKARLISLTDSSNQLDKALDRALELISGRSEALILVLTDGGQPIPREDLLHSDKIRFLIFGTDRDNTAITRFQPRRSFNDPRTGEIFMEISRFGKTPFSGQIEIDLNGTLLEIVPFSLKPNQSRNLIVPFLTESGGILTARIVPGNAYPDNVMITKTNSIARPEMNNKIPEIINKDFLESDNSAQAYLPNYPPLKLFLLRKPGFFMEHALKAQAFVEIKLIESVPKELPINSVLILEKEIPVPCPSGNIFLINPQSENDLFKTELLLEPPIAMRHQTRNDSSDTSLQHYRNNENIINHKNIDANSKRQEIDSSQILRFAPLDNSPFPGAKKIILKTKEYCHVLLQTSHGNPLLFLLVRPQGKVLVLNTDPDRGEMALTTAFPIFISNLLNWFRHNETNNINNNIKNMSNNDIINITNSNTKRNIRNENNNIEKESLSNSAIESAKNFSSDITFLFDEDQRKNESDLSTNFTIFSSLKNRKETLSFSSRSIRYWLTLVAFGLTILEWYFYQRRWID